MTYSAELTYRVNQLEAPEGPLWLHRVLEWI